MNELSEHSLKIAADIYFGLVFCPEYDALTLTFYKDLFENFSAREVVQRDEKRKKFDLF